MALAFVVIAKLLITLCGDMSILLATITLDAGLLISIPRFVSCNICSSYWTAGTLLLTKKLT